LKLNRNIAWVPGIRSRKIAGFRLRCALVIPHLLSQGCRCQVVSHAKQLRSRPELVIFQKAYRPEHQAMARKLSASGIRTVLDLCDNHLVTHPDYPEMTVRRDQLLQMLSLTDAVTCSTAALAETIPHPRVLVVDDMLDYASTSWVAGTAERIMNFALPHRPDPSPVRFLWHGHAGSDFPPAGLSDLPRVLTPLSRLNRERPVQLTVVSNSRERFRKYAGTPDFPVVYRSWKAWKMPWLLRTHDACLIPVTDNEFTRCKTVNRPASALLSGLPVISEFVPSYAELRDYIALGEMEHGLRRFLDDPAGMKARTMQGRDFVRHRYAPDRIAGQWLSAFERICEGGHATASPLSLPEPSASPSTTYGVHR
jgi:hypothetical protein